MFGLIESEALFQPLDVDVLCILCSYVFDTDFGHHTHIYIYIYMYICEKPIYALDVPCRCTNVETSPFDRANGSSSARCGKQAARTPHKSEKCNVGRSSDGTGCRLSLLGCGYPFLLETPKD